MATSSIISETGYALPEIIIFFGHWLDLGYLGICKINNQNILYCFIPFLWFILLKEEKIYHNNVTKNKTRQYHSATDGKEKQEKDVR